MKKIVLRERACRDLRERHEALPAEINNFYRLLNNLRDEPGPRFEAGLKNLRAGLKDLRASFARLAALEEGALFPFLAVHIPRLESLTCILLSEHEDFSRLFGRIDEDAEDAAREEGERRRWRVSRIKDEGAYLICLLRSHLWAEGKDVYPTIERELKPGERRALAEDLASCSARLARERKSAAAVGR